MNCPPHIVGPWNSLIREERKFRLSGKSSCCCVFRLIDVMAARRLLLHSLFIIASSESHRKVAWGRLTSRIKSDSNVLCLLWRCADRLIPTRRVPSSMNMVSRFIRHFFAEDQADKVAAPQAHEQSVRVESVSRRHFLRGGKPLPIRPPWALPEDEFVKVCSGCSVCIAHCPQQLLVAHADGFPVVDFMHGPCTFCGECAVNCPDGALLRENGAEPWRLKARVGNGCLARLGTFCRSCGELCEVAAIRFRPQAGGPVSPEIDDSLCTGCGACFQVCPVRAIRIV